MSADDDDNDDGDGDLHSAQFTYRADKNNGAL